MRVETASGTIRADRCIVTVSTGVLAAGAIRFTPALPVAVQEAVDGLPMGVLNKVALRAAGADRLDLPESCGMDQFVPAIDAPAMSVVAWPHGADHVICFAGGSHAAAIEAAGRRRLGCAEQWRALFGERAERAFRPGAVVTRWAERSAVRRVLRLCTAGLRGGAGGARGAAGRGRLVFAGEAVRTDGLAGTVGGAFCGEAAALRRSGLAPNPTRGRSSSGHLGLRSPRYSMRCRMIFWMSLVPS